MAKAREVDCSQVEQMKWLGGAGAGQGHRKARGLQVGFTYPLPHPALLTVSKSGGLQRPEQLTADALAIPSCLSQALGHCEVKGIQITAGVSVMCRFRLG